MNGIQKSGDAPFVFRRLESNEVSKKARQSLLKNDLEPFWGYLQFNKSREAPYHNEYHLQCVTTLCAEGAAFEELCAGETRSLLLGALFHDYNHSAGRKKDEHNITEAIEALTIAIAGCQTQLQHPLTLTEVTGAISGVEATEFPYTKEVTTSVERIIRDADRMQAYETDTVKLIDQYLGLKQELERQTPNVMSVQLFADHVSAWNSDIAWCSNWGRARAHSMQFEEAYVQRLEKILRNASVSYQALRPKTRAERAVQHRGAL